MKSLVTLEVTSGGLKGKEFHFEQRDTALVGRGLDCNIRLPDDKDHATISRNHCIIDINPPSILIHDFASLNGTFVNDELIGRRKEENTTDETEPFSERPLYDGDTVRIGGTTFKISVSEPAPENEEQPSSPTLCTQCGKQISADDPGNENPVCPECRQEVRNLIANLLEDADKGDEELVSIKGFSIKRELGRGGMGAVYLARAENEDKDIAIKVMLPETFADLESRKTFLREAEVTQALKHPNIVRLYDTGFHNGIFYFTMEYCDGGSMDQHVQEKGGKLGWSEALSLIGPCLDGLEYLHNAGLICFLFLALNLFYHS